MRRSASLGEAKATVLVVADDLLVREGIRSIVGRGTFLAVEIDDPLDPPELVVIDLGKAASVDSLKKWALTTTPVLALVEAPTDALHAVAAGASGALLRDATSAEISAALRAIHSGLAVFDRSFLSTLLDAKTQAVGVEPDADPLTPREKEVLLLLVEGLSNKEIADRLKVSEHTAKFHVNQILQKLNAQRRVEAVVRAARLGIIDL